MAELRALRDVPEASILGATLAVFVGWSLATPHFLTVDNLLAVAQQIAFLGIVATGVTLLLIAGELDLSVGSAYGFLAVLLATLVDSAGLGLIPAIGLTLLAGIGIGAVNGTLSTRFLIPSFIVTLGMLGVLRGLALGLSNGLPIGPVENATFHAASAGKVAGVPAQVVWLLAVLALGALILARTRFGYHVYAAGGNLQAAANCGIKTGRVKLACFMITGALVALVAILSVGWLGSANPLSGTGFELQVIAAVVIGGASLFGGAGSILGSFLGAALIGMLSNGLVLVGVDQYWQQFATGSIIVVAALMNVTLRGALRQGLRV